MQALAKPKLDIQPAIKARAKQEYFAKLRKHPECAELARALAAGRRFNEKA